MQKYLFVAIVGLAGCGATVHTTTMPGANLTQYHTFSFRHPSDAAGETLAAQTVRQQIASSLESKGLRQVSQNPDFVISEEVMVQQRTAYVPAPYYYGYYYGTGGVSQYTEGTLIVDFIDPKTNQVFWRGTASDVVNRPNNPDLKKVADAVNKLMGKYPAQMASSGAPARM